mmetsp:Transcript_101626/g.196582  ORF Transcript_101626/g.196582 Transcript_101626/m.196582 type:complete len:373 (-) Transcript_101626:78-1196(-)
MGFCAVLCMLWLTVVVEKIHCGRGTGRTAEVMCASATRANKPFVHVEVKPQNVGIPESRLEVNITSLVVCPESDQKCYAVENDEAACIFFHEYQGYTDIPNGDSDSRDCAMRAANNFLGRIAYDNSTYDKWLKLLYEKRQDVVDILHTFGSERQFDQLKDWVAEIVGIEWDKFTAVQDKTFDQFIAEYWWLPTRFKPNNEYSTIAAYMLLSFAPYGESLWFMPIRLTNIMLLQRSEQTCIGDNTHRLFIGDKNRGHAYAVRYCRKTQKWQKLDSMVWRKTGNGGTFHTRRTEVQPDVDDIAKRLLDDPDGTREKLIQLGEGFDLTKWQNLKARYTNGDVRKVDLFKEAGMDDSGDLARCYPEEEEDVDYDIG